VGTKGDSSVMVSPTRRRSPRGVVLLHHSIPLAELDATRQDARERAGPTRTAPRHSISSGPYTPM
jgi:hypothetical protein